MRWFAVTFMCVFTVEAVYLHCGHPQCHDNNIPYPAGQREREVTFTVEGHNILFNYEIKKPEDISEKFQINCNGWQAFDSPAMPRFIEEYRVSRVILSNCPLPRYSFTAAVLSALNVTLLPYHDTLSLELHQFPAERLAPLQFAGLEHLTHLKIYSNYGVDLHQTPTPEPDFLSELQKLQTLHLVDVRLPAGELYRLPKSLTLLRLGGESLNLLPGTLSRVTFAISHALPDLQNLLLDQSGFTVQEFPSSLTNKQQRNATYLHSRLKSIFVMNWKEENLKPMDHCDGLISLQIESSKAKELPAHWIAACPHLIKLTLFDAEQVISLPAKLLEGAIGLKHLSIRSTMIRTLPVGFLEGAPNLRELDLSDNRLLGQIPSGVFLGPALKSLNLERNHLCPYSLTALATMTSLTSLELGGNQCISNLCEKNDYSLFRNLTHLRRLSLRDTRISHICRDWREDLTSLETLDVSGTGITPRNN